MMRRGAVVVFVAWLVSASTGFAGTTTVPATRSGQATRTPSISEMQPSECASMTLTARVIGSGTFAGTSAAELVLADSGTDAPSAAGGTDCILGGDGNDAINGGSGTDVCIGGGGLDTFVSCETQVQ